jgi:hypothetical protein
VGQSAGIKLPACHKPNVVSHNFMTEFRDIIGKKLEAVSFSTSVYGHEDFSKDDKADFDYLPLGGLTILFEDKTVYCIADYFSTSLGTNGVGVKLLDDFKPWPNPKGNFEKWTTTIGKELKKVTLYWNKETWNNGMKNEMYPESVQLTFDNYSVFYFCGEVDDFNYKENRYNLLSGHDAGIIFYSTASFKKHNLDKVEKLEEITAYNNIFAPGGVDV